MAAALGSDWGFRWLLAECGLKAWFFPTVIAGLNNQRGGEKVTVLKFKSHLREYSESKGSFGGLFGLNIRLIIFSGLVGLKKGVFRINNCDSSCTCNARQIFC
jgi:hypothetical protein